MSREPAGSDEEPTLPAIGLLNYVLFPGLTGPMSVGTPQGQAAANAALAAGSQIAVFAQRRAAGGKGDNEFFEVGVRASIRPLPPTRDKELLVQLEGLERIKRTSIREGDEGRRVGWEDYPVPIDESVEAVALLRLVMQKAAELLILTRKIGLDSEKLDEVALPQRLYVLLNTLRPPVDKAQEILQAPTQLEQTEGVMRYVRFELEVARAHERLLDQAGQELRKDERDQVLRYELATIHKELGDDAQTDLLALGERVDSSALPPEARAEVQRQLHLLERAGPLSAEYNVSRNYVETLVELPWAISTKDQLDLPAAREVLDFDHYGLEKVKERILEHLAVMQLNPSSHAPILCFVGPPGTGKTSLGKSIARALGRKFERLSLGGMHDEAELRGHRRTYVGAMTGRVIQAIRRSKVNNPLLMLDEVDKLRQSYEGDPAAALLEVLDPAQNHEFHDNYLDVPFDLSGVFFITTANSVDTIPSPLLDRMEVISLCGYTPDEKLQIARRHLLPRLLREAGLPGLDIPDETLTALLEGYTREAGVRQLERAVARLARRLALSVAEGATLPPLITPALAGQLLGPEEFRAGRARPRLEPGVAAALAYTESGGEILYVEVARLPDSEPVLLTGNLGEVMKESARAARSYLLSRYPLKGASVHLHVPAGSTPKDGPSAGLAMVCALASAFTKLPARADTGMTGEITLSGLVLPVGGLKEKILSAQRAGLKRVVLPRANAASLEDLPLSITRELEFRLVDRIDEVLPMVIPGFEGSLSPDG